MEKLQQYLDSQFKQDNDRLEEILNLIRNSLPLFYETFHQDDGWPYRVEKEIPDSREPNKKISFGTLAMTSGALKAVREADLPSKIIYKTWREKGGKNTSGKSMKDLMKSTLDSVVSLLSKNLETTTLIPSETYGANSVFVLSWICDLLKDEKISETATNKIVDLSARRLTATLLNVYDTKKIEYFEPDNKNDPEIDVQHAFPLLKAIYLYEKLLSQGFDSIKSMPVDYEKLEEHLLSKLHYFISLAEIENSRFDAAELVFSLESLLIIRKLRFDPNDGSENASVFLCDGSLLERVFSILKKKQEINSYWRPLCPFITTQQGLALLPISVEITQSLIRICEILGDTGKKLFAQNCGIFARYFDWIKSKVTAVRSGDRRVYGWASEHVYSSDTIHIWQTSQILIFLTKYYIFLRNKVATDALSAANLSAKCTKESDAIKGFWETKPFNSDRVNCQIKTVIEKSEEKNSSASFLLYGPPGTGKTTFAEQVSILKKWPLLSLSPSDFIADGVDKLETKAKNLFTVLRAQHNLVILFDEIDRLLLNRNSEAYRDQGDMFQVMVASLLVKFKDLRDTPHIIFMINTNYGYRLDPAIVRPGRVDKQILVMLPDKEQRKKIVVEYVEKLQNINTDEPHDTDLRLNGFAEKIAQMTPLFAFGEMKQLMEILKDSVGLNDNDSLDLNGTSKEKLDKDLISSIEAVIPMVSLSQYTSQIKQKQGGEGADAVRAAEDLPLDEILMIAYTLYECDHNHPQLAKEKEKLEELINEHKDVSLKKIQATLGDTVHGNIIIMLQELGVIEQAEKKGGAMMQIEVERLQYVFKDNRIIYASVPITTGWRYLDWLRYAKNPTDKDAREREVTQPNILSARKEIKKLRRRLRCTVIDPTQYENAKMNWSQENYYSFWDSIIKYVVTEIVFIDGWECSTGCCHELISALEAGKPVFTQDRVPLSVEKAIEMISKSLDAYGKLGRENPALDHILKTLKKY